VAFGLPRWGGRLRSLHTLSELAHRHQMTVLTTHGPDDDPVGLAQQLSHCERVVSLRHTLPKRGSVPWAAALARSWFSPLPLDMWKCRVPALEHEGAAPVVPLRIGGGTRLKILEALAMGKAVVSTTIGAEGLPLVNGEHFIAADSPVEITRAVVSLLRDPTRRAALGTAGRQLVEQRHSWKRVAQEFEQLAPSLNPSAGCAATSVGPPPRPAPPMKTSRAPSFTWVRTRSIEAGPVSALSPIAATLRTTGNQRQRRPRAHEPTALACYLGSARSSRRRAPRTRARSRG
jgi:hypothetical protein